MKNVHNSFFFVFVSSLVFGFLLMTMKHFIVLVDFCDSLLFENGVAWSNERLYMHIHETLLKGGIIPYMLSACNEFNSIHKFLDDDVLQCCCIMIPSFPP
jgi:hypothetical protein